MMINTPFTHFHRTKLSFLPENLTLDGESFFTDLWSLLSFSLFASQHSQHTNLVIERFDLTDESESRDVSCNGRSARYLYIQDKRRSFDHFAICDIRVFTDKGKVGWAGLWINTNILPIGLPFDEKHMLCPTERSGEKMRKEEERSEGQFLRLSSPIGRSSEPK